MSQTETDSRPLAVQLEPDPPPTPPFMPPSPTATPAQLPPPPGFAAPASPTLPTLPTLPSRPAPPPPIAPLAVSSPPAPPRTATPPPGVISKLAPGTGGHRPPVKPLHRRRTPWSGLRTTLKWRLAICVIGGLLAVAYAGPGNIWNQMFGSPATERPTEWDARVVNIADFVADERGLTFEHPINVNFLPEDDFVDLFAQDEQALDADTLDEMASFSKVYDAFGLAARYDMNEGQSTVFATTSLGFYSPQDDEIFVRGDELTPAVRVVLAHELTHALQAQHFDLDNGGSGDLAFRSVVEADAMRVERAYQDTLPAADQSSATDDNTLDENAQDELSAVPWAVVDEQYAPYVLGPMLVNQVYAENGNAGVDELLQHPPTEEVLISPWLNGTNQTDVSVAVSVPTDAVTVLPSTPLSMLRTLMMLDAWLPWTQARGALDGWAGGGYAVYKKGNDDGPVCVAATIQLDGPADALASAINAWATAAGSATAATLSGNAVSFEACERGATAAAPPIPVVDPLAEISFENLVVSDAGARPTPDQVLRAECRARLIIDDPSVAPLMMEDTLTAEQQALVDAVQTRADSTCGPITT